MPNDNVLKGMACPKCKSEGPFDIDCTVTFTVWDDGTDLDYRGIDWEPDSRCVCKNCEYKGTAQNFETQNAPHRDDAE